MRVHVETVLPCSADAAWSEVCKSSLLVEIASPLVTFAASAEGPIPETWCEGETVRIRSFLFGVLPLGTRTLFFEQIDPERRQIQTRERDRLVRRWDHLISLEEAAPGTVRYTDDVEIHAGMFTPGLWLFAMWFYRHRQRRWRRLAKRLEVPWKRRSSALRRAIP